jgi:hypothetical protein
VNYEYNKASDMTRLNSASSFTDLAPGVYERSNTLLRYLGEPEVPYDMVEDLLTPQGADDERSNDLLYIPQDLEARCLKDWDEMLMDAFRRNEQRQGSAAFIAGAKIAGVIIHETFERHAPDLQPLALIDTSRLQSAEAMARQPASFAAFVLGSLSVSMGGNNTTDKKVQFPDVEPTLYEKEEFDRWIQTTMPDGRILLGGRTVKREYDTLAMRDKHVVPVARIVTMGKDRPVDVTKPALVLARWTGNGVEIQLVNDTPKNRDRIPEWKQEGCYIFNTNVSDGHKAIVVTPRNAVGLSRINRQ